MIQQSTINVKAFAAAFLALLTSRKDFSYYDANACVIGLAAKAATGKSFAELGGNDAARNALGIDDGTYTDIFVRLRPRENNKGRPVKSPRTMRRNMVIRSIKALTKGQPATPELALLQTIHDLLVHPQKYQQSSSTFCIVGQTFRNFTGRPLSNIGRESRRPLANGTLTEDLLSNIFWMENWPSNLVVRWNKAKSKRQRAYIGALRALVALSEGR